MSETDTTATQGGGEATANPEPAALDDEGHAPADTGAALETKPTETDADRAANRIARLTSRYAGKAREAEELAARVAQLEATNRSPQDTDFQRAVEAATEQRLAERHAKERAEAFHEAGRAQFPDWQTRCQALMAMGADAQMSSLLVEMKDGAKVAASLHDDPDELERIARLSTPTARAIALGVYAGRLDAAGTGFSTPRGETGSVAGRAVSRAPAPIRPVQGRANPQFNEYTAGNASDGNEALVDYYMKQDRLKRGLPG
jgi:hypothetical protein